MVKPGTLVTKHATISVIIQQPPNNTVCQIDGTPGRCMKHKCVLRDLKVDRPLRLYGERMAETAEPGLESVNDLNSKACVITPAPVATICE